MFLFRLSGELSDIPQLFSPRFLLSLLLLHSFLQFTFLLSMKRSNKGNNTTCTCTGVHVYNYTQWKRATLHKDASTIIIEMHVHVYVTQRYMRGTCHIEVYVTNREVYVTNREVYVTNKEVYMSHIIALIGTDFRSSIAFCMSVSIRWIILSLFDTSSLLSVNNCFCSFSSATCFLLSATSTSNFAF